MLWNVDSAIARLEDDFVELDEGEMDLSELRMLKERLTERETLMLRVFTGLTVEETLPANFWPCERDDEGDKLH